MKPPCSSGGAPNLNKEEVRWTGYEYLTAREAYKCNKKMGVLKAMMVINFTIDI
jgi:hypothetical protein